MVTAVLMSIVTKHRKIDVYQDSRRDNTKFKLYYAGLNHTISLVRLVQETHPDEIYKPVAQSYVAASSHNSEYRAEVDEMDALRTLKTIHLLGLDQKALILQAGSSDCYSLVFGTSKKEITPFYPRRSDVIAKRYAYRFTAKPMACMLAMASCLNTKAHVVAKPL
jgi:GDP-D-mannose dehydratase